MPMHMRPRQRRRELSAAALLHADAAPGGSPASDSAVVRAWPELAKVLPDLHAHAGAPPSSVAAAEVVDSLDGLLQQVQADAAFW